MRDIELKNLRFGHEDGAPPDVINVRRVGRDDGIDALAASIEAHGLIQPLTVIPGANGLFYTIDGNRRLAAMRRLEEAGKMPATAGIPFVIAPDESSAREVGLAANVMRAPLHEADQYEAFHELADGGVTEDAIASRFGIEPKRVRKIVALGQLSPKILAAWRAGELGRDPADTVRAFTLAPSLKDQERVFEKCQKGGGFWGHSIRKEFGADRGDATKHLRLVGIETYRAAGGRVVEDLFGDDHAIQDPALASKLAKEKLQVECDRLIAAGWSWAKRDDQLPDGARYSWSIVSPPVPKFTRAESKRLKKLEGISVEHRERDETDTTEEERTEIGRTAKERSYNDEDKARSGCIVSCGHRGDLDVRYGVIDPKTQRPERAAPSRARAGDEDSAGPTLSNALAHRLSVQMTLGLQEAVKSHPHAALAMLLAGASCSTVQNSPVRVSLGGLGSTTYRPDGESFHDLFGRLVDMTLEQLAEAAAQIVPSAITFETQNALTPIATHPGAIAITTALDPERTADAISAAFDAADYFASASKPFVMKAIEEAVNADEARKAGKLKKSELVEFAVANVKGTGWLPPEIRPATYSGPGAAAAPMAQAAE